jgi:hypothetical protein
MLSVAMLSAPFLGTATAQTSVNTQTGTGSATVTNTATDVNSVSQVVYYNKKQVLADGGIRYTFIINGVENVLHVPPVGFDPMKATDAELAEYGWPARPKDQKGLTGWQNTWGRFKPKVSSEEPTITIMKRSVPDSSGTNWSGYADYYQGDTNKFWQVNGFYNQPDYNVNSPANAEECSWVGLGGNGNTKPLIQAGTWNTYHGSTYYAFYMYLLGGNTGVGVGIMSPSQVSVHPGDSMYADVDWTSNPAGFEVWDWTTFTNFFVTVDLTPNYYDGESAEFIDERPYDTSTGLFFPLAGFDKPITWYDCEVFYSNSNQQINFGSIDYDQFTMLGGTGYPLVTTSSPPGANSFTDTWNAGHYQ